MKESPDGEATLDSLLPLCRVLRGEQGCPWDRRQTISSLTPYILEEAHELIDAIAAEQHSKLAEELGDLIFLLVFCIEIARERGLFTLNDVVTSTQEKMRRRHPHVFGETDIREPGEVCRQWEEIKLQEEPEQSSLLEGLSPTLSALVASFRLQEKAAAVGFDWPKPGDVIAKMREELQELEEALSEGRREAAGKEIGDLLFSVVNLARKLGENPEVCLRHTMAKFQRRFAHIEKALGKEGKTPSGSTLEEMDELWNKAKRDERE
ncbi:MAG: nucleoside triphosphate pyrophosphohydrolase [Candidatus Eiseniibacteriota bacterium]|nr:MAG: nucleoside triphosphate pyrophosphohydrolase [Candidatus Eisenbacteria bacterium]